MYGIYKQIIMLDNVSRFFLNFSHDTIIIPLIIIGYIWIDRKVFFHGICLLLTSMLLNLALKITFQVPLAPSLGKEGFAFPSGHMQSSIVLYGWLFKSLNKLIIKVMITMLLIGISAGLVHLGYHNYFDIFGAVFAGLLLIFLYSWFLKSFGESILSLIILLFSTLLMVYICLLNEIKEYSWLAYYSLIGVIPSEYCFRNKQASISNNIKVIATIFCVTTFLLVNQIFLLLKTDSLFLSQLKWLFIGFCIPFSLHFLSLIKPKSHIQGD